jgi:hypothetical protein
MPQTLSLAPDPRLLPMLGEIDLSQERCLAELVDNSIDGFLKDQRQVGTDYLPLVAVELPSTKDDTEHARISVKDNGPGMPTELLEKAVKAGWTGNDPISNLGLFGMGFNIATARLGRTTHVWTTMSGESEWRGIEIDFFKLIEDGSFVTDLLTKPKEEKSTSGTEIVVSKLKSDQLAWFTKLSNHGKIKTFFSKIYSTMLRSPGQPIHFQLLVSGKSVNPRQHCIWGDGEAHRSVSTKKYGQIDAYQPIQITLDSKKYCIKCWSWAQTESESCHICGATNSIVERKRRITGWVGILRYLSETEYGIDLIRNGRKIEIQDRSLFKWEQDGVVVDEYPIDDPRRRGRIVGEIHLDHCRVSYTKDRFDRDDSAWKEMTEYIRGKGPLRPDKANQLGFGQNVSSLFLLFQAFRRSTPTSKVAGAWESLLAVKDNDLALEFAKKYYQGEPKYQTDEEWFKLVKEADKELLFRNKPGPPGTEDDSEDDELEDIIDSDDDDATESDQDDKNESGKYFEEIIGFLSRDYVDDKTAIRFEVEAYSVELAHPKLTDGSLPWKFEREPNGTYKFYVNRELSLFTQAFEPLDALLAELAHTIYLFSKDKPEAPLFSELLGGLRTKYVGEDKFDISDLIQRAEKELTHIARFVSSLDDGDEINRLFNDMSSFERNSMLSNMAAAGIRDSNKLVFRGMFLEYAPPYSLIRFIEKNPEIYFDGNLWDIRFNSLSFDDIDAQKLAREGILRQFSSLLSDLFWLSKQTPSSVDSDDYGKIIRAQIALDTLISYRDED